MADPGGVEGPPGTVAGLGLLDLATTMAADKVLRPVSGAALGMAIAGYEMHMGATAGPDAARPMAVLAPEMRGDGAISKDGLVMGCTVHGLFAADGFRRWFLATLRPGRDFEPRLRDDGRGNPRRAGRASRSPSRSRRAARRGAGRGQAAARAGTAPGAAVTLTSA